MKKINLFKIAVNLFGLFAVMAVLSVFTTALAFGGTVAYYAVTGAVVAGSPVDTKKINDGSSELLLNHISQKVVKMRPAATPLDTIMREIGIQTKISSWRTDYYAVDSRPLYDTVKTAYTKAGDGNATYDLNVNNIATWSEDDTVMVKGVTGSDGGDLVCFVISKNIGAATIKIQPINGSAGSGTTAGKIIIPASIPLNTRLVRMGPAKNELDAMTSPYGIIPVKDYNFVQYYMAQVEESTFAALHDKEVNWNFSDYEAQNIYDLRATMEQSFLFGARSKFYDEVNAKERYLTGGITRFITKALTYGTGGADRTIDNSTFVDWSKSIFTGNCGADTRLLFGGDGLMANLSKVDTVQKQIEANKTFVKWGITFKQIETNFGIILFKHHPLLDQAGWGDNGIVLDINNIEKHTFKPMATRKLDLKGAGIRNVDAVVIEEATGVVCRYPDTHAIIRPTA